MSWGCILSNVGSCQFLGRLATVTHFLHLWVMLLVSFTEVPKPKGRCMRQKNKETCSFTIRTRFLLARKFQTSQKQQVFIGLCHCSTPTSYFSGTTQEKSSAGNMCQKPSAKAPKLVVQADKSFYFILIYYFNFIFFRKLSTLFMQSIYLPYSVTITITRLISQ